MRRNPPYNQPAPRMKAAVDCEILREVQADLTAMLPFSEIATRHSIDIVEVALIHRDMQPQPVARPGQLPVHVAERIHLALLYAVGREPNI